MVWFGVFPALLVLLLRRADAQQPVENRTQVHQVATRVLYPLHQDDRKGWTTCWYIANGETQDPVKPSTNLCDYINIPAAPRERFNYSIIGCRDCTVGDCLAVPKAEGGCDACICNGLLVPDCAVTNCSAGCAQQPTPDGCLACVCPETAPNVCPPIPACPSRCQIQLGNGCPRCTCPEKAAKQCPAVTCPPTCTQATGTDGCPACECPPEDRVCPKMPACPLGCIDLINDPPNAGCLACNCTIIEELLSENQLVPTGPETPPENSFGIELVTDSIDPGLVEPTEPFAPNQTPTAEIFSTPGVLTDIVPNQTPSVETFTNPGDSTATVPNKIPNAEILPTPGVPTATVPELVPAPQTPTLPNPFLNNNGGGNNVDLNIPVAPRIGPNSRLPPGRASNQVRRPINIPCGETFCPPRCSLCIQNNGCGRCLCGDSARICPAVPPCQVACITSGRDGCFTCSCPAPGVSSQGFNPFLGPSPFASGIAFGSDEVFLSPSGGGGRPPFVQFVRGPSLGPPPGFDRRGQPGQRRTSPARVAVQNIPANLLGQSRFQFFS